MSDQPLEKVPAWACFVNKLLNDRIFEAPGKRVLKISWWVNFGKFPPVFLFFYLMHYYDKWSKQAWVYTALHGV
jgi:hypothetical protein